MSEDEQCITVNNKDQKKRREATRTIKIKPITEVKISGPIATKLGCIENEFQVQTFIAEVLSGVSREDYLKFKLKHVSSQEEFDRFVEKFDSCEIKINMSLS